MATRPRAKPVRILVVGTGSMAAAHVRAYQAMPGVTVVAGVDTRPDVLKAFQTDHAIPHGFATVQDAIAWGGFDAVSNVTPDSVHKTTTLPLLAAGKHVLCEKPLATSHADAAEMADAAARAGVVNMVNLTYRNVPALQAAQALVAAGTIGPVRHFEASYLQSWLTQPAWGDWKTEPRWLWRLSTAHGSNGVLGDVGVHILDYATFVIGAMPARFTSRLATFDKAPGGRIDEYTLDANDSFVMETELTNGALGTISATRFASGHLNDLRLRVYGDTGGLEVLFEGGKSLLRGCIGPDMPTATWRKLPTPPVPTTYRRFVDAIRGTATPDPTFARGAALQAVLDAATLGAGADLPA
jgi:predicted dehydrogenase